MRKLSTGENNEEDSAKKKLVQVKSLLAFGSRLTTNTSNQEQSCGKWPPNVNEFMHLARQPQAGRVNESSLDWMLGLRSKSSLNSVSIKKRDSSSQRPPSVYFKQKEGRNATHQKEVIDVASLIGPSSSELDHLIRHRLGAAAN
mmetsp:Transcript_24675/g.24244  ORF Transcript_24675/g.24244 Transcript_24675/m.24244 type:complete len:144 (+) Transcript_24675:185-616(+)|eukprot:CAMPEP_0170549566 /NCGR_PEP_ID=MMETSP0211-20121228/7714_1 /TAXON_ID=311385 /ORGANISM="Pseudokeronopsis sp., Strain OXSARD2" /LENGTH=143 /DNA_ID=CAMNT_0010855647 /DNA_START=119 /DNA_END=550 /DNA_ORIENTATION=+